MAFNIKEYPKKYFKKKSAFGIVSDLVFIILIVLLINPGTRTELSAFFIKLASFPPSTLDAEAQVMIGASSANWQLTNKEGGKVMFKELNQKPVFLNVWATWCPPCVAEMPGIAELQSEFGEHVNFVMVTNDAKGLVDAFV